MLLPSGFRRANLPAYLDPLGVTSARFEPPLEFLHEPPQCKKRIFELLRRREDTLIEPINETERRIRRVQLGTLILPLQFLLDNAFKSISP